MRIKMIKNRSDYEMALDCLVRLLEKKPLPDSDDQNDLELLLLVISDYEQKMIQKIGIDPIEAIKFRMEQMNLSRNDLIPCIGSISKVSEVLTGKRNLSISMIHRLHEQLGIPFDSLLAKQRPARKRLSKKAAQKHPNLKRKKRKLRIKSL